MNSELRLASVLVDSQVKLSGEKLFDYLIPENLQVEIGDLVCVEFGNKLCRGFVVDLKTQNASLESSFELKEITEILSKKLFQKEYLKLIHEISDFYLSDFLTTLKGILPIGLLANFQERVFLLDDFNPEFKLSPTEQKIITLLRESAEKSLSLKFIKQKAGSSTVKAAVERLAKRGIVAKTIHLKKEVKSRKKLAAEQNLKPLKTLNDEQSAVFEKVNAELDKKLFKEFLLHGITGCGKTEIYFHAAQKVLDEGGQVIFLVPEISLSVQLLERIKSHFSGEQVTLWHSNLADGQRLKAWQDSLDGSPRIVVGARSAIFAPLSNLRLIIIDEEHDASYKSGSRPFYDARWIAQKRAELSGAVILAGSATPSIGSYYTAAQTGNLLQINRRFQNQDLPPVEIIDMRYELSVGNKSVFSRKLKKELLDCISRNEQAILLLNRRGHSNYVFCRDCGEAIFCDHCSVPMVYHSSGHLLRCHHCNESKPVMQECPKCTSPRIKQTGLGTQKLEEEVVRHFPQAQVLRLDRDISQTRHGTQEVWDELTTKADPNRSQILVGTQLVAKGLDLPRVTLVASVHTEGGLYSPEFNSAERTFQLLTQAAGRAGRHDKPGKVIFQTYTPESPIIQYAAKQDYLAFYENELFKRQQSFYPPFKKLARLLILNENLLHAQKDAQNLSQILRENTNASVEMLGPAPCPIERVNKLFRWHLLLKTDSFEHIKAVHQIIEEKFEGRSRINLDIMPSSLL